MKNAKKYPLEKLENGMVMYSEVVAGNGKLDYNGAMWLLVQNGTFIPVYQDKELLKQGKVKVLYSGNGHPVAQAYQNKAFAKIIPFTQNGVIAKFEVLA